MSKWIQSALGVRPRRKGLGPHHHKSVRVEAEHQGALHRSLGVPVGETIPAALLHEAARHPERFVGTHDARRQLQRRALFALTMRGLGRRRRRR